mmetsp:Transcript_97715/g.174075  ORF Transcript_97715/g.174075 Transcript_97715/m.174075 type:complete len:498 (-) Transcript_97715:50-1543(-)
MATAAAAAREFVSGPRVIQGAQQLLSRFSLESLCEALANARQEDAEPLILALEGLTDFDEVRPKFLDDGVKTFLGQGASAADPRLRAMVAKLLAQVVGKGGEAAVASVLNAGILSLCEPLLVDEETGVAENAARAVQCAVQWPAGREALLGTQPGDGSSMAEQLQNRLPQLPEVQRIRALSLFVELGRSSECFAVLENRGAYQKVLDAFLTDDLLLKLNAVELMDALSSYDAGQAFLGRAGLPEQLARELADPYCEPSIRLCVTRLLGLVLRRTPSTASVLLPGREAPFPLSVAGLMDSRDQSEKLCALNAWVDASTGLEGLTFFLRWTPLLQDIVSMTSSTQNEVAKGAMAAWAAVLEERPPAAAATAAGPEAEIWEIAEQRVLPLVLKNLTGKPFPDVRPHTWHLLAVLVRSQKAAQQAMPAQELRDLLLNFQSEQSADARIEKHKLVQTLMTEHRQFLGNFLNEEVYTLLTDYVQQGPYWVPRGAATAVGDSSG